MLAMYGYIFDMPASTTVFETIGDFSKPILSDLIPLALMILGIGFAVWVITWIAGIFTKRH